MKKFAVILFLFLIFACAAASSENTGKRAEAKLRLPDPEKIKKIADDKFDLTDAVLEAEMIRFPGLDKKEVLQNIEKLAAKLRPRLEGKKSTEDKAKALAAFIFAEEDFNDDADDPRGLGVENAFLGQTLKRKRGACMGLSLLYLALAEKCGIELYGTNIPRHFFLAFKTPDGVMYIEPLAGGVIREGKFYLEKFDIDEDSVKNGAYLGILKKSEILGAVFVNVAYFESDMKRRSEILKCARALNPNMPEVYQLSADTYARLGRYADAEKMLDSALSLDPLVSGAYALRGISRMMQGKVEDAEKDLSQALMHDDECAEAIAARLYLRMKTGNQPGADRDSIRMISTLRDAFDKLDAGKEEYIASDWMAVYRLLVIADESVQKNIKKDGEPVYYNRILGSLAIVAFLSGDKKNAAKYLERAEKEKLEFSEYRKKIIIEKARETASGKEMK